MLNQFVNDVTEAILTTSGQIWLMTQIPLEDLEGLLTLSDADLADLTPPALPSLTDGELNQLPELPF
jgi:hypothetical protein